jgi:hypothetical protein
MLTEDTEPDEDTMAASDNSNTSESRDKILVDARTFLEF